MRYCTLLSAVWWFAIFINSICCTTNKERKKSGPEKELHFGKDFLGQKSSFPRYIEEGICLDCINLFHGYEILNQTDQCVLSAPASLFKPEHVQDPNDKCLTYVHACMHAA